VSELFNTHYSVEANADLRPSQSVATIVNNGSSFQQVNALWGIKPNWSKKLIINAQAETVATKPTFKQAFQSQRFLVPCNGWFEWRTEEG
jgi:putative SOS response-associated peptidase YedK